MRPVLRCTRLALSGAMCASLAVALAVTALAGCTSSGTSGGRIAIVAGTNAWGAVAAEIGGDRVTVHSILSDPNEDPHLYESDVKAAAFVAKARLVIANGLGYDAFLGKLLSAGHRPGTVTVTIADVVHATDNANVHLWYSPDYAVEAARAIASALDRLDHASSATYQANLARFMTDERQVTTVVDQIKSRYSGAAVAYTEPVPAYLVDAAGLHLGTPAGFSRALEDGTDPTPADSTAFARAITQHSVRALLYNSQVSDPETKRLRTLAEQAGVPVVAVSETMPAGSTYTGWQSAQARALLTALGAGTP